MNFLLAMVPIISILFILFVLRKSAWKAGLIGCLLTVVIALFAPAFKIGALDLVHPSVKGTLISSTVTYVIMFGILLFHLMNEKGVIQGIAAFISNSTKDPIRQVILLAIAFSPLLESASGFGIAMIIIAPILIALGFDKYKAVLISLVSLSAVPWGTLAMGTVIGANLGGFSVHQLGVGSAILSVPTFIYFGVVAVFIAGGWQGVKSRFWELLLISGSFGVTVLLINEYISVELAGIFGSLVAIGIELLLIRYFTYARTSESTVAKSEVSAAAEAGVQVKPGYGPLKTFGPYIFLIVLLLFSRVVPPVEALLKSNGVVSLPEYNFELQLLFSPGFFLLLTCIFAIVSFKIDRALIIKSVGLTWKQGLPVVFSTLFFVIMSEIMSTATMTQTIAGVAAATFGSAFLVLSPVIGGFGGFLTGSNTGSNAMFIKLQVATAQKLGIAPELFAYGQNTASSHLIMSSPSRVLLGATICGAREKESELLRKITLIGLGTIAIVSLGVLRLYFFS